MSAIATKEIDTMPARRFAGEEEFEAWCDEDTKAEYVDGEVFVMTPASTEHDSGETALGSLMELFVQKNKLGRVSSAGNTQVRLQTGLRRNPDIVFVEKSRMRIVQKTGVDGAADLVDEFVSPESAIRDWHEKYIEYGAAGVREYWIIDRDNQRVAVYSLGEDRRYQPIVAKDGKPYSQVLPRFWVSNDWFWQGPLFDTYETVREMRIFA